MQRIYEIQYRLLLSENAHDPESLFKLIYSLLSKNRGSPLPEDILEADVDEEYSNFCMGKVNLIHGI